MPRIALLTLLVLAVFAPLGAVADSEPVDFQQVVDQIRVQAETAMAAYSNDTALDTADVFSDLYFDQFEASGMELAIGMQDPGLKSELESHFGTVIGLASREKPKAEVQQAWNNLYQRLRETADAQREDQGGSFWSLLLQSAARRL